MDLLAKEDVLCVILKTKSGLPMFETGIADGIIESYPEVTDWYIGGHSMGGIAAASYVADHMDDYEGLVLLASYVNQDMSESDINVLCIYGTCDGVMNKEMYEEHKSMLPKDFVEVVIEGGCHSYFADYGIKGGDGVPTITMETQIKTAADSMLQLMK